MKNRVTETKNQQPGTGFSPYLSLDQSEAKNRFSPEPRTGRRGKSIEIWYFLLDLSRRPRSPVPNLAPKTQSPAAVVVATDRRRSPITGEIQTIGPSPSPSPLLDFGFLTRKKNRRSPFSLFIIFCKCIFIIYIKYHSLMKTIL